MSNNYDIRFNQKQPSSEEIARHKDFDALLEQYKASAPQRRNARVIRLAYVAAAAVAVAASVLLVINFLLTPDTPNVTPEQYFAAQPAINPPVEAAAPTFAVNTVNAEAGATIETERGTKLVVPTQAFMNDRGALIEGDVNVHYRELHDYVDFFLAGVPMNYDSNGMAYQLESAGMIEVFAEQNGERVQMAPGKVIEVELVTVLELPEGAEVPDFTIHKLDTASRSWQIQDVAHIQIVEDLANASNNTNNSVNALRNEYASQLAAIETAADLQLREIEASVAAPPAPLKPMQARSDMPSFEADFLEEATFEDDPNTPENEKERLQALMNRTWQIVPNTAYDERDFQITWENIQLQKLNNRDYELTGTNGDRTLRLIVTPVLTGTAYQQALAAYEQQYADWEAAMAAREAQLKEQKEALAANVEQQKAAARADYREKLAELGLDASNLLTRKRVINRFEVNEFGLWNCDRVIAQAEQQLTSELEDQFGQKYEHQVAYLVNKKHNTIYRYYVTEDNPIRFDSDADNLLWVVTEGNKIAVLKPTNFKKALTSQRKTVELELVEKPIREESDARAVLTWQ